MNRLKNDNYLVVEFDHNIGICIYYLPINRCFSDDFIYLVCTGFLFFWGMAFLIITTLIAIAKKETDNGSNDDNSNINIFQSFAVIWDILKIPHMKILVIAVLTATVRFLFNIVGLYNIV